MIGSHPTRQRGVPLWLVIAAAPALLTLFVGFVALAVVQTLAELIAGRTR